PLRDQSRSFQPSQEFYVKQPPLFRGPGVNWIILSTPVSDPTQAAVLSLPLPVPRYSFLGARI
ncbi:MAG: hypothetical protein P5702_26650, partial [Limnospira sp. PMC 1291.21]